MSGRIHRRRRHVPAFSALFLGCLVLGCTADATGPRGSGCATAGSIDTCIDRSEYAPGDPLALSFVNRSSGQVRLDRCALALVEKTDAELFPPTYQPTRRCGPNPSAQEILTESRVLGPGETHTEMLLVPGGLPQGFYRVYAWLLDDEGMVTTSEPVASRQFDVFPSAGR